MIAIVSAAAARVWMTSGLRDRARGADVRAEALALPVEVALEPVVVEPGLADRDDLRARRRAPRGARRSAPRCPGSPGCTPAVAYRLACACASACTRGQSRRSTLMHSACVTRRLAHGGEQRGEVGGELGEVEVAVGVDEHGIEASADGEPRERPAARDGAPGTLPRRDARPPTAYASAATRRASRPGSSRWSRAPRRRSRPA